MIIFPAIDMLDGRCVRLLYGDKNKVTDYGDPIEMAYRWKDLGAQYMHIVDLNGAFSGQGVNLKILKEIASKVGIPVQCGGGIRTYEDVKMRLDAGVSRVILGTIAVKDPELTQQCLQDFPNQIVIGVDAKDDRIAVNGWEEKVDISPTELGLQYKAFGLQTVLYTDISRDGALQGVNTKATINLQNRTGLQVIASGGVSSLQDILALREGNVYGAIIGKALFSGAISLPEALKAAQE